MKGPVEVVSAIREAEKTEALAALVIRSAAGIGAILGNRLVREFGSAADALAASTSEWATVEGIRPQIVEALRRDELRAEAEKVWSLCRDRGVRVLVPESDGYPPHLLNLIDRPLVLFARGACVWPQQSVALVGTRLPSPAGLKAARDFARFFASRGIGVVSGLARGIDTAAHEGALEGEGITLAVIGSGLDAIYPAENRGLAAAIEKGGGTILSEYAPDAEAESFHFPVRNRIISGLAQAVVVVEAPRRSGALGTADWALEQGREVLAVPGGPFTRSAEGSLDLIKNGAACVTRAEEVLEWLRWENRPGSGAGTGRIGLKEKSFGLSRHKDLLAALKPGENISADELHERTGLEAPRLLQALTELESAGTVQSLPGRRWCLR